MGVKQALGKSEAGERAIDVRPDLPGLTKVFSQGSITERMWQGKASRQVTTVVKRVKQQNGREWYCCYATRDGLESDVQASQPCLSLDASMLCLCLRLLRGSCPALATTFCHTRLRIDLFVTEEGIYPGEHTRFGELLDHKIYRCA